jgi:hypothetical protein
MNAHYTPSKQKKHSSFWKKTASIFRILPALLLLSSFSGAQTPKDLAQWTHWVTEKEAEKFCPQEADANQTICAWPTELQLKITPSGADFSMKWKLFSETSVALPGGRSGGGSELIFWPLGVRSAGKTLAVINKDNLPIIKLPKGEHSINGKIPWKQIPQQLRVPDGTGRIILNKAGKKILAAADENGMVWIGESPQAKEGSEESDAVRVQVFRKLSDGLPMILESEIRLLVSGKDRVWESGSLLTDGFELMNIESPLPVQVEEDGSFRLQVRAGSWTIKTRARTMQNPQSLRPMRLHSTWPATEIWTFAQEPELRTVRPQSARPIDPQQSELPSSWKSLPAWLLSEKDSLLLQETLRGQQKSSSWEASLKRNYWLAFDGKDAVLHDELSGRVLDRMRLLNDDQVTLGRAERSGDALLITHMGDSTKQGLELAPGDLDLEITSQLHKPFEFAVSGWNEKVSSVGLNLHMPPGWKLWHVSGPDNVSGTWISQWTLWTVFWVLLIAVATARLLNPMSGVLVFLSMALSFHSSEYPGYFWVVLLIVQALFAALAAPKARLWFRRIQITALAILSLLVIDFSITQVRLAIYPQLEQEGYFRINNRIYESPNVLPEVSSNIDAVLNNTAGLAPRKQAKKLRKRDPQAPQSRGALRMIGKASKERVSAYDSDYGTQAVQNNNNQWKKQMLEQKVQTGPGIPLWNWNSYYMSWSGNVSSGEQVHLYTWAPLAARTLRLVETLLLILLLWIWFIQVRRQKEDIEKTKISDSAKASKGKQVNVQAALFLMVGALVSGWSPAQAREYPSDALLHELKERSLPELCSSDCQAIQSGQISILNKRLRIELDVAVSNDREFILPVQAWQPDEILVDGRQAKALRQIVQRRSKGASLAVALSAGNHRIRLSGGLNGDLLQLPFTARAHNLEIKAPGWIISGLDEQQGAENFGSVQGTLELKRQVEVRQNKAEWGAVRYKNFVRLRRDLKVDRDWTLYNRVTRLAPQRGSIHLRLPIWPGESIVTAGISVEKDSITIVIPEGQQYVSWTSRFQAVDTLALRALEMPEVSEIWSVQASPLWHMDAQGIPANNVRGQDPVWQPRPGEALQLILTQPQAVDGPTRTIEHLRLHADFGKRSADMSMDIKLLAGQGGELQIPLPKGATLKSLQHNEREQILSSLTDSFSVNVMPGGQSIKVNWDQKRDDGWWYTIPEIQLPQGLEASNVEIRMSSLRDHWVLWMSGPAIGPVVLLWGILAVLIAIAWALGYYGKTPIKTWQWILLFVGLSGVNEWGSLPFVLWIFALTAWPKLTIKDWDKWQVRLVQTVLLTLTLVSVISVLSAIPMGLLGRPDMHIINPGSGHWLWFQDSAKGTLPQAHVLALPLWVYRGVMLVWALWLVWNFINWIKWAWQSFASQKYVEKPINIGGVKTVNEAPPQIPPQEEQSSQSTTKDSQAK